MSQLIEAGYYLCMIDEWAIRQAESGAVSVSLKLGPVGVWDSKYVDPTTNEPAPSWVGTPDDLPSLFSDVYVIDKKGQVIQTGMEQVVKAGVWCDDFAAYDSAIPPNAYRVVVQVKAEVYQGKTQMKPAWLYPDTFKPGSGGIFNRADKEKLMTISNMHGASLRAAAASIKAGQPA